MRSQFKLRWADRLQFALGRQTRRANSGPWANSPAAIPATAEWDEAFLRVESHLRAYRIESRVRLNQLASEIINDARAMAVQHPDEAPVTLAMQITHARIGGWLVQALGEGDWADERFRARGRLAILMAEIPRRCPELFLSNEKLPAEVELRMRSAYLRPGPNVRLSSMRSAPLDFPLGAYVDQKWRELSRAVVLRSVTVWCALFGLLSLAWFATR